MGLVGSTFAIVGLGADKVGLSTLMAGEVHPDSSTMVSSSNVLLKIGFFVFEFLIQPQK